MALTASNVRVAVTGALYRAPLATALPTDVSTPIANTFIDQGYLGDAGVVQTIDASTDSITAWQNADTVRTVQTSHDVSYQFTLIEFSAVTLETVYGNHTTGTTLISGAGQDHHAWVLHVIDGSKLIRICLPDAQITEIGDVTFASGEEIGHELTITAYPDTSGNKAYLYMGDAA